MTDLGHEVITYGTRSEARCVEHVEVVTDDDRARWFPNYDPETDVWDGFQVDAEHWRVMNARVISAMRERQQPDDFLGIIAGLCQREIADAFPDMITVEFGVGYAGVFAPFRVFESHAWRHYLAAKEPTDDVRLFDAVIPNSFELDEFVSSCEPGDYLLYLGRMTPRKGLAIVEEIAKRTTLPVVTAGQGPERVPGCEHLGVVRGQQKAELLANARAVLVPTMYLEPFGGVAVEAMLSGSPAITTDYAAFSETVDHGVSGFRCSTLRQFLNAVDQCADLDRQAVRDYAVSRYSTDVVGPLYVEYFERLETLRGDGWYAGCELESAHG